jgi:predicted metal-dependent hydrolase
MKRKVNINNLEIEYNLIFKNKKNISIKIDGEGEIHVFSPKGISYEYINKVIIEKSNWILKTLKKINKTNIIKENKILFLGEYYNLVIKESKLHNIYIDNKNLVINSLCLEDEYIRNEIMNWYRKLATDIIGNRVMEISNKILLKPSKIIIKNQKSLWGSCNSKKEIRLNWRLVLMPYFVIDYIIIHELCHIIHMNHSKDFWDLVKQYCPNYKESKNWLKENGAMLMNLV